MALMGLADQVYFNPCRSILESILEESEGAPDLCFELGTYAFDVG